MHVVGCMYHAINYTFIYLIPKVDSPLYFNDFRHISLCNCLYKIISKIIAHHLNPILSFQISFQQFSFLQNRQMHESFGMPQEVLQSIKTSYLKVSILKINISKVFD